MTEEREGIIAHEAGPIDTTVGRVLDGRYRLLRKLGQGGMGSVYLAEDQRLSIKVAVKVIVPKMGETNQVGLQRFRFEAHAAARIQSDHVVRVSDFGVCNETNPPLAYIAMELLQGENLSTYLERSIKMHGPLSWSRAKKLIIDIARGLAAVHKAGLVHRDMKPSNCFLVKNDQEHEQVKVFDFGIAKSMETSSDQLTREGVIIGTMAYMAPEQAMGKKVDGRTDIYALGAILFQMLSGSPPFIAGHWHELLAQIANTPPPMLSAITDSRSLPLQIDTILQQTLQKDPDRRFSTIADFISAIEALELEPDQTQTSQYPKIGSTEKVSSKPATTIIIPPEESNVGKAASNHGATTSKHFQKRLRWTSSIVAVAIISGLLWKLDILGFASTPKIRHVETAEPAEPGLSTTAERPPVKTAAIITDSTRSAQTSSGEPSKSTQAHLSTSDKESNPEGQIQAKKQADKNADPLIAEDQSNEKRKQSAKNIRTTPKKSTPLKRESTTKNAILSPAQRKPKNQKPSYTKPKKVQQQLDSLLNKSIEGCKKLHPSAIGNQTQVMIEIGLNGKIQRFTPLISQKTSAIHSAIQCVDRILRRSLNIVPRLNKVFETNPIIKF